MFQALSKPPHTGPKFFVKSLVCPHGGRNFERCMRGDLSHTNNKQISLVLTSGLTLTG